MLAAIAVGQAMAPGAHQTGTVRPRCAVLSGAAWPKPFEPLFHSLASFKSVSSSGTASSSGGGVIPTLHCVGTADAVNPPEMAEQLQVT